MVGKTASCAAMALTVGSYAWPQHAHAIAVLAVVALTAVNYVGVQKSAWATRTIVRGCARGTRGRRGRLPDRVGRRSTSARGLRRSSGRHPAGRRPAFLRVRRVRAHRNAGRGGARSGRTIRRAIPLALAITLATYLAVAVAVLAVLGPVGLASAPAPLADAVRAAGANAMTPVVRVAATIASVGSLLALMLGVSRTTLAMARDLPHALAAVHPRFGVPYRAELAVGCVVAVVAAFADVRAVIGFSSFACLSTTRLRTRAHPRSRRQRGGRTARFRCSASSGVSCWRSRCRGPRSSPELIGATIFAIRLALLRRA